MNCVVDKFKSKVSLDIYDKGFGLWITCEKWKWSSLAVRSYISWQRQRLSRKTTKKIFGKEYNKKWFQDGNEREEFYQQTINELLYKTTDTRNSLVGVNDNGIRV